MVKQYNNKKGAERRNHERVDFSAPISIMIETEDDTIEVTGDSQDLSLKGMFIPTDKKVPLGSHCIIKIFLSGTRDSLELNIQGVIARAENNGLGIIFDSMDVDSFTYLKNIVKYNSENN